MKTELHVAFVIFSAVILQGCAHIAEKQVGKITSEPEGASVFFYSPIYSSNMNPIGLTPVEAQIQQGLSEVFIVVQKAGYETERRRVPSSGSIAHHFVLQKSFSVRISEEGGELSIDFKRDAARAVSTFDRALKSPRMLAAAVVSEARAQLQEMALSHPAHANSATMSALKKLSAEAVFLTSLDRTQYNRATERIAAQIVSERIRGIRKGLGIDI